MLREDGSRAGYAVVRDGVVRVYRGDGADLDEAVSNLDEACEQLASRGTGQALDELA